MKRKPRRVRRHGFNHLFKAKVKRLQKGLQEVAKKKGMMDPRDITFEATMSLVLSAEKFKNKQDANESKK